VVMVILYLHRCPANTAGAGVISYRSVMEWFMVLLRHCPKSSVAAAQADVFQKNSDNKLNKIDTNMKIKR